MSLVSRPLYRTRQFIAALNPRIRETELREVGSLLGPGLTPLFEAMTRRDRRHCLDVYAKLRGSGCDDEDTLTAALLHDRGKSRLSGVGIRLWHRVAYVLLDAAAPLLLSRLTRGRGAIAVLANHAELGAGFADSMGASPKVVKLIREHEDRAQDGQAHVQLRAADDDS